jgi:hypothetical protein
MATPPAAPKQACWPSTNGTTPGGRDTCVVKRAVKKAGAAAAAPADEAEDAKDADADEDDSSSVSTSLLQSLPLSVSEPDR